MRKIVLFLLLFLCIFNGCNPARAQADEAQQLREESQQAYLDGDYATAIALNERALALSLKAGDIDGQGRAKSNLGLLYWTIEERDVALDNFHQAIDLFMKVDNVELLAQLWVNVGLIHEELMDDVALAVAYEKAIPLLNEIGNQSGEAMIRSGAAGAYAALGQPEQALPHALEADRLCGLDSVECTPDLVAANTTLIGLIYRQMGNSEQAERYYERAADLGAEGDTACQGGSLRLLGDEASNQNDYPTAFQYYEEALDCWEAQIDSSNEAWVRIANVNNAIAIVYSSRIGNAKQARFYHQAALDAAEKAEKLGQDGAAKEQADALVGLGLVASLFDNDNLAAIRYYQEAIAIFPASSTYVSLASSYERERQLDNAYAAYLQAQALLPPDDNTGSAEFIAAKLEALKPSPPQDEQQVFEEAIKEFEQGATFFAGIADRQMESTINTIAKIRQKKGSEPRLKSRFWRKRGQLKNR